MADTIPGGASFDLSNSTFHGPVFNNAVFQEALTITHALQAAPAEQKALADALETLRRALAGLPEVRRPEAAAAAEAAKQVVAAAKPEGHKAIFLGAVGGLRGIVEEIGKITPAIGTSAEAVIKLAGQVRGWF